ncbi:hypothetical protein C8R45DRAFT_154699 [Mycena sanguinolenta]|nr:hypothetical protein C8R45DRAFT_154699 [Mycena sanguinolenta]
MLPRPIHTRALILGHKRSSAPIDFSDTRPRTLRSLQELALRSSRDARWLSRLAPNAQCTITDPLMSSGCFRFTAFSFTTSTIIFFAAAPFLCSVQHSHLALALCRAPGNPATPVPESSWRSHCAVGGTDRHCTFLVLLVVLDEGLPLFIRSALDDVAPSILKSGGNSRFTGRSANDLDSSSSAAVSRIAAVISLRLGWFPFRQSSCLCPRLVSSPFSKISVLKTRRLLCFLHLLSLGAFTSAARSMRSLD